MQSKRKDEIKVGVLGPQHTFTDLAADWYIRSKIKAGARKEFFSSIWDIFEALKKSALDFGIVPIENNVHGTVRETFDYLFTSDLHINFQFSLPIHHSIAVKKGTKSSAIKKIVSHQQVLNQCHKYLLKNFPKAQLISFPSTAAAIKNLKATKELNKAVICAAHAADEYNLKVIDKNIEDQKHNRTWFAVLGPPQEPYREKVKKGKNIRTSIAFYFQNDKPGTLFGVFKDFADAKINLTKIESRPTVPKWGDYIFFLDFEGGLDDEKVKKVLEKVKKKVALLKIFGSYVIEKAVLH